MKTYPGCIKTLRKLAWNFKNAGQLDKEIWDLESIIFSFHVEHYRMLWPWTVVFFVFFRRGWQLNINKNCWIFSWYFFGGCLMETGDGEVVQNGCLVCVFGFLISRMAGVAKLFDCFLICRIVWLVVQVICLHHWKFEWKLKFTQLKGKIIFHVWVPC